MAKRKQGGSLRNALLNERESSSAGRDVLEMLARSIESMRVRPEYLADELCGKAEESENPGERAELVHRALKLWPDCSRAYLLLSRDSGSMDASLPLLEQAVSAAERDLVRFGISLDHPMDDQDETSEDCEDYFTARSALAACLHDLGRTGEAVAHFNAMLALDPGDAWSIRYLLCSVLLGAGQEDEAVRLVDRFWNDGSAIWLFVRAFLAFRRQGDCVDSRKMLKRAIAANARIPELMCTQPKADAEAMLEQLHGELLQLVQEAAVHLKLFGMVWHDAPEALAWMDANWTRPKRLLGE